jgi:hypothetical protein
LVKGFWRLVSRDKATDEKLTSGRDVILDSGSTRKIGENVQGMQATSGFASKFKNILTCAHNILSMRLS